MRCEIFQQEDGVCANADSKLGAEAFSAIHDIIKASHPVGFITGYFDDALTISDVSGYFLQNLGYEYDEFMKATGGSLKNLVYGENRSFLEPDRWPKIDGAGDGQLLTKDGAPVYTRLFKRNSVDQNGTPIWVMSARVDWTRQNLYLINNIIQSGLWYIDCNEAGAVESIVYSHEFRKMLGYHDILDFPNTMEAWVDGIHPEDRKQVIQALNDAVNDRTGKTRYDIEYRMKTADGSYHWFRDSADAIRRLDGTVQRLAGVFINMDRQKKAELQAKKSEAFHRVFTESNLCEYYIALKSGRFDSLKGEESMLAPYEKSGNWDTLVQSYLAYLSPKDREIIQLIFDRDYIARKLNEGKAELAYECAITRNGETRWVRNVVMPGERGDASNYAIAFIRDITDARNEADRIAELTQQNQALDLLVQGTRKLVDHFALCDLNADHYRFYDLKEDKAYPAEGTYQQLISLVGKRFKLLSDEGTMKDMLAPEKVRAELHEKTSLYRFEYSDLKETQFKSVAITPVTWQGTVPEKVLLIAQDITREKRAEIQARSALKDAYDAANRANSAKTEFLSNMSHDIRTPMNAIVGMTAIACANIDSQERVLDCLGKITQSSRHLLALINEVLDMSRIESGKVMLTEEDFNLAELLDNLIAMTRADIAAHRHHFEVHLSKIEHEDVCGDSLRIQQVITNIMSNAIKYTPDGGNITFSIAERPTQSKKVGCYEFTVQDNGIGMTPEFQKVLFEPFTRADDKRTTKVQGTGLGMAIARNIVNMMNGTIKVESQLGKGSKFTVTIFLKLQEKEPESVQELIDLPVLVVDDDPLCCESTVDILNDIGLDGEYVTSGKEAVARAVKRHRKQEDYFAILMDWKMPEMDGIEATRQIRRQVGKEVPIIVLTAYDYTEIEEEARAAGVNVFIAKPLFRSRLTAALKSIVEGRPGKSMPNDLSGLKGCHYDGKHILLVEDNELNSEIAKELLEMTGASVETAENGKMAVEKFAAAPTGTYDLIFMDIQMPLMNGYEAAAAIRSMKNHGGLTVPIVAMTANAFAEDIILSKNAGMNEHIAKPLDLNKLNDVLHRWL